DDFGMMREVLRRRFSRLLREAPRQVTSEPGDLPGAVADPDDVGPWPDLVLIDGGQGQLGAALETLADLGIRDVPLVGIAKGPDRDAGRETFHLAGCDPFTQSA